jgi:hypothetical protein
MIATAVEVDDESDFGLMTIYHWHPPKVSAKATVMLSPALLRNINGFASLGTFFLSEDVDTPTMLSDLLATQQLGDPGQCQRPTTELLTTLISRLPVPDPDEGRMVHFVSFHVLNDNPHDVAITGDGLVPVWKWVKPDGTYRKAGFWEAHLAEALEDGEWNAGKNLHLLVRGVAEAALRRVTNEGVKVTNFDSFSSERLSYCT